MLFVWKSLIVIIKIIWLAVVVVQANLNVRSVKIGPQPPTHTCSSILDHFDRRHRPGVRVAATKTTVKEVGV